MEKKPASSSVVSLGKTLYEMSPSLCGRQVVGPSSLFVLVAQSLSEEGWWWEGHLTVKTLAKYEQTMRFCGRQQIEKLPKKRR